MPSSCRRGLTFQGIASQLPKADAGRVDATQAPLSGTETVLVGLVVSAVVITPATWRLVGHFHVMAHEGMHGAVGALSGRTVQGIRLADDATGGTRVVPDSGPGYLVAGFVGYLGSSAFGLGAARLIQFGHIVVVLWLILKHTSQTGQILAVYVITWFLLLSGVRGIVEDGVNAGDAVLLSGRTSIPRLVWFALWLAGTGAAVVIGARWMLHPAVR
jgi:hypothetical protein